MDATAEQPQEPLRRLGLIREEMRFEIGVLHDRINALISAEAFLLISFTMSLAYLDGRHAGGALVAPVLSLVGLLLAILAWPGVNTNVRLVVEWNVLLAQVLSQTREVPDFMWPPSVAARGDRRVQADHRRGLLFARLVPAVFVLAWTVLAGVVLAGRWR